MNKNLILGAILGYGWSEISIFVKSFKKHLSKNTKLVLLSNSKDLKFLEILKLHDIEVIYCNSSYIRYPNTERFFYLRKFLNNNCSKYNKVLFTDVRDVFFQKNIFNVFRKKSFISFFQEDSLIKDCMTNSLWLKRVFNDEINPIFNNKFIICAGTIIGDSQTILKYLNLICRNLKKFNMKKNIIDYILRRPVSKGFLDQPICNYLVYSNIFNNIKIYSNKSGPVATVGHMKKFIFDDKVNLINSKSQIYSLVHQYDRKISVFKKTLNKLIN
jgi:hypothetical protein